MKPIHEICICPDVLMDTCELLDDLGVPYGISEKSYYTILVENPEQKKAIEFLHDIMRGKYNAN